MELLELYEQEESLLDEYYFDLRLGGSRYLELKDRLREYPAQIEHAEWESTINEYENNYQLARIGQPIPFTLERKTWVKRRAKRKTYKRMTGRDVEWIKHREPSDAHPQAKRVKTKKPQQLLSLRDFSKVHLDERQQYIYKAILQHGLKQRRGSITAGWFFEIGNNIPELVISELVNNKELEVQPDYFMVQSRIISRQQYEILRLEYGSRRWFRLTNRGMIKAMWIG